MKCLVHHTPTEEDITIVLKEFGVDFLLKGYSLLVGDLHAKLLKSSSKEFLLWSEEEMALNARNFLWLIGYFLKFAAELQLDLDHIRSILTYNVISYLTYEGVNICELLDLSSRQEGIDLKPYLRSLHSVVTAIREFLKAIEDLKKGNHLSNVSRRDFF